MATSATLPLFTIISSVYTGADYDYGEIAILAIPMLVFAALLGCASFRARSVIVLSVLFSLFAGFVIGTYIGRNRQLNCTYVMAGEGKLPYVFKEKGAKQCRPEGATLFLYEPPGEAYLLEKPSLQFQKLTTPQ